MNQDVSIQTFVNRFCILKFKYRTELKMFKLIRRDQEDIKLNNYDYLLKLITYSIKLINDSIITASFDTRG